jgi:hypothetical protein
MVFAPSEQEFPLLVSAASHLLGTNTAYQDKGGFKWKSSASTFAKVSKTP